MIKVELVEAYKDKIKQILICRGIEYNIDTFLETNSLRRKSLTEVDSLRAQRNKFNEELSRLKEKPVELILKAKELNASIKELESQLEILTDKYIEMLSLFPNIDLNLDTPIVKKTIVPKKIETYFQNIKDVWANLPDPQQGIEYPVCYASKMVLKQRRLINTILEQGKTYNMIEIMHPSLVKEEVLIGSGDYPVLKDYLLRCERDELVCIHDPTTFLLNYHANQILNYEFLPLKYCAFVPDIFNPTFFGLPKNDWDKTLDYPFGGIGIVYFSNPEETINTSLNEIIKFFENIMQSLKIPYVVTDVPVQNLAFAWGKTYWIEAFYPEKNDYYRIAYITSYDDFISRRTKTRVKTPTKESTYPTMVGAGLSIGLLMAAQEVV